MGCELTKLATSQKQSAEDSRPEADFHATPSEEDKRVPLTMKQKYTITASWRAVARAMDVTGVNMFLKLFENNAELLEMFSKFKNLKTKEEQSASAELQEHATKVMNTLDVGIKGLDNVDNLLTFLHQKIEEPFLEAVKMTLDERYTANMENLYKVTIKFIIETLIEGFDKAEMKKGCSEIMDDDTTQEEKVPSDTTKS